MMKNIDDVIAILERKTTVPNEGESFEDISEAFDSAIECLKAIKQIVCESKNDESMRPTIEIISKRIDIE